MMATGMFENETSALSDALSSPTSIPLPDSPPDANHRLVNGNENAAVEQQSYSNHEPEAASNSSGGKTKGSNKSSRKPRLIEEYDPCFPLTSSDEEEHSMQLIEGGQTKNSSSSENSEFRNSYNAATISRDTSSSRNSLLRSSEPTSPPPSASPLKSTTLTTTTGKHHLSPNSLEPIPYPASTGPCTNTSSSEEKRRPTIHFSIPTRHRLLPISTLIKRQKGSARRDGKGGDGTGGGNADSVKGSEKLQDGEEDEEDLEDAPKISLVAEIFGDDDDDEDEIDNKTESNPPESLNKHGSAENQAENPSEVSTAPAADKTLGNDTNSGRWKIVANESTPPPIEPLIAEPTDSFTPETVENVEKDPNTEPQLPGTASAVQECSAEEIPTPEAEDEPEIIEIVTINVPTNNRLRPLRRRPFLSRFMLDNGEPEVIDIDVDIDNDKEEEEEHERVQESVAPAPTADDRSMEPVVFAPPPCPSPKSISVASERRRKESRSRSRSPPEKERPHFRRPHSSSSVSNCEEGEIVDQVNSRRRKKDKKKKVKKRKRSRDSTSPPSKSSDKRTSDATPSSDKEDNSTRSAISWRKPSKRTQNRNYRDGKPKADDTFFREKEVDEKQRSISPNYKRNRGSFRKERSPPRDKSSSKYKREAPAGRNRSISKSPSGLASESRSEISRRRHRQRRSRSDSSSSDRSASRSRRRSAKRRYRRSSSRQRGGGSRSPSYITELIRSRSSNYSKVSDKSRSRSREKHGRGRHRKNSISRSRSRTPSMGGHRKNRRPDLSERLAKRRQGRAEKEKEKPPAEEPVSESKERRKEKEKLKEKEKRKKKEKPQEEEVKEQKEQEKVKEKERKKKKKRREKSPTPVKAIVADGDSIVVSLSFSKGKSTVSTSNAQTRSSTEDHASDHQNGITSSENAESANDQHSNVNGSDVERGTAPENAHHVQNSPAKANEDTDGTVPTTDAAPARSCPALSSADAVEEKEAEITKVTSSGGASCGSRSPFEAEQSCSAVADSTKVIHSQQLEQYDSSFSHSRRSSSMSPTDVESNLQGDYLVTSTGDTMERPLSADEEPSKLNSSSAPSKTSMSPRFQGVQNSATSCPAGESSNTPAAGTSHAAGSAGGSSAALGSSSSSTTSHRPLIGNIPGLYATSAIANSGGAAAVPPPIVIPTPPPPQGIRFSGGAVTTPMLNPNVLASVASALLAVRQSQPVISGGKMTNAGGSSGNISDNNSMQLRHMNILGPKSQNLSMQSTLRSSSGGNFAQDQGGDSPMSPNSSEGDDLFEPPTDKGGNSKLHKSAQLFGAGGILPGGNSNDNFNAAGHVNKERSLFDTLFDTQSADTKKSSTITKPVDKNVKTSKQKVRKGPKKETIKVNTSGGLAKGELRLTDEVPTSAVELIVKQKYLKKLNRQERVVEEVKLSLKPHYSKRHVNKEEYKEILRRAVPKICHNKTGEINPGKIKELVEAYVKKFRHARKRGLDISSIK